MKQNKTKNSVNPFFKMPICINWIVCVWNIGYHFKFSQSSSLTVQFQTSMVSSWFMCTQLKLTVRKTRAAFAHWNTMQHWITLSWNTFQDEQTKVFKYFLEFCISHMTWIISKTNLRKRDKDVFYYVVCHISKHNPF